MSYTWSTRPLDSDTESYIVFDINKMNVFRAIYGFGAMRDVINNWEQVRIPVPNI